MEKQQKDPLGKYISTIYRHAMMYANKYLKPFNISGGQLSFLLALFEHNGITQEELSKYLNIDKSTTAKAIKSLEQNGYITRKTSEQDKRAYNVYTTNKAALIKQEIRNLAFKVDNKILLKGFNDKEKKTAYNILKRIAENAGNLNIRSLSDGK